MENEPKEYAKDLVWKYYHILEHTISNEYSKVDWEITKQCALIAVDELIKATVPLTSTYFWQEVKQEIEEIKQEIEEIMNLETGDIIYTINYYCYVEVHDVNKEKQTFNGYCLNISQQEQHSDINAGFIELTFDDIEKHFKPIN